MTNKTIFMTSAILMTLSLPLAHAGVRMAGTITVADLAKETLAKKTLKQAQASAAVVAGEADELRQVGTSMCSPDWHVEKLTALKREVNRMGQEISSLRSERESISPWERQAVDEVLPLLQAIATNAQGAIQYFNENRDRLWVETYREYVDGVWHGSDQMAKVLKSYLESESLTGPQVYAQKRGPSFIRGRNTLRAVAFLKTASQVCFHPVCHN